MKKNLLFLLAALLLSLPTIALGQTRGLFHETDCGSISNPNVDQVFCLQETTVAGRTAGHTYVWKGPVSGWVDTSSAGGVGDALVANPLSQFAATTSAQLAGVLTNETGTGLAVFNNTPTLITPDIGAASGTSLTVTGAITSGSGSGVAGVLDLGQGTLPSLGTTAISLLAPTSVTSYGLKYPGAAPAANQALLWGAPSSGISTGVFTQMILGAANISAAAMVPFASAAGTLTASADLTYASNRLRIGNPSSNSVLSLGITSSAPDRWVLFYNRDIDQSFQIQSDLSSGPFRILYSAAGTIGLGVLNSSPTGTVHIKDGTASTGATRLTIALGAADSASTVTETNAGTTKAGGYQSSDGSPGVTVTTCTGFKNGLCISGT